MADGLVAESALFSALQAGPEHRAWRAATPRRAPSTDDHPRVRAERHGDVLTLTLDRPGVRNALDRMRLRQATRLFAQPQRELTRDDLTTIECEDIRASRVFTAGGR